MSTPHGPDASGQSGEQENPVPQQPQEMSAPHAEAQADAPQFVPPGGQQPPGDHAPGKPNALSQGPGQQVPYQGPSQNPQQDPGPSHQGPPQQGPGQGYTGQQPIYAAGHLQHGAGNPAKKSKTPLWIGLGLVAVAVVVALVLVLSGVFSNKTAAGGDSSELPADPKEAAKAVVTNYLTAVSEGRAEDAKKFLSSSSVTSDASLLTDEVLKDSLTRAPITEITVGEITTEYSSQKVPVTYKVAGEPASEEYTVGSSENKIFSSLPTLGGLYMLKGVDLTVNGVAVKSSEMNRSVFPGSYVVASANKYLEVVGENTILITSSKNDTPSSNLKLKVSQAGIDLFREKVIPEAKACLASTNLDPGCNMAISATLNDGTTLTEGSITRTQDSENAYKLENVVPEPGSSVPTIISARDMGSVSLSATCTDSSGTGPCTLWGFGKGSRFPKATLNVAEDDPKVVWEDR